MDRFEKFGSSDELMVIAEGRIRCRQCSARSKRTGQRCKAPAMRGKSVCRTHGGLSTGARTPEGKQRQQDARTKDGRCSKESRARGSKLSGQLSQLEDAMALLGVLDGAKKTGRKSAYYKPVTDLKGLAHFLAGLEPD